MKVNIRLSVKGWVFGVFANELKKRLDYVSIDEEGDFDIFYYINHKAFRNDDSGKKIALFTHIDPNEFSQKLYFDIARKVDFRVCMAKKYEHIFEKNRIRNVKTISPGIDLVSFQPKLKLGFVGTLSSPARKGKALLEQVHKLNFVEMKFTLGELSKDEIPDFYRSLDYCLITSKYEGGPMCLIEALACGIPVIAPSDIGMVPEFKRGIYQYKNSDFESLKKLLLELYRKKLDLRSQVERLSWDRFADEHDRLFKMLAQGKR